MATGNRQTVKQCVIDERVTDSGRTEPLFNETVSVTDHGSTSTSLRQTIPSVAVSILNLDGDDEVRVEVYQDGYWVEKISGETDE